MKFSFMILTMCLSLFVTACAAKTEEPAAPYGVLAIGSYTVPIVPDAKAPEIMVCGTLYTLSRESEGRNLNIKPNKADYLDRLTSVVPISCEPTLDCQANVGKVGAPYVSYGDGIALLIGGQWTLFGGDLQNEKLFYTAKPSAKYNAILQQQYKKVARQTFDELRKKGIDADSLSFGTPISIDTHWLPVKDANKEQFIIPILYNGSPVSIMSSAPSGDPNYPYMFYGDSGYLLRIYNALSVGDVYRFAYAYSDISINEGLSLYVAGRSGEGIPVKGQAFDKTIRPDPANSFAPPKIFPPFNIDGLQVVNPETVTAVITNDK